MSYIIFKYIITAGVEFGINANHKVGIIGIGGLGHLAINFYKALGCHVTAFTSSQDKNELIKSMGADEVVSSTDQVTLKKYGCEI